MRFRVEYCAGARQALGRLPKDVQPRIRKLIAALADDPSPPGSAKLTGKADLYRIRSGRYRVLYEIASEIATVTVVHVGHRADIYRRIRRR